jgi:hypothetical protein
MKDQHSKPTVTVFKTFTDSTVLVLSLLLILIVDTSSFAFTLFESSMQSQQYHCDHRRHQPAPPLPTLRIHSASHSNSALFFFFGSNSKSTKQTEPEWSAYQTYPEANPATYELLPSNPFDITTEGFVRPLLKQTQLENRKLKVVYDANRDGYDARIFHQKVDGKGAAIVLCKAGNAYFGGYNPRGWASLAGARSSKAAFLFYKSGPFSSGPWKKLRALNRGGNSISVDLQDQGIYFGADGLVIPLRKGCRDVASRLGRFYERGNDPPRNTILPSAGRNTQLQELKVLVGTYAPGEDIPNSAGVSELGFY